MAYDSQKSIVNINLAGVTQTSAQSTGDTVIGRATVQSACVVRDFNVQVGSSGDTGTSGSYVFVLNKMKDGTGTRVVLGTASQAVTGNVAANSVIDGAVAQGTGLKLDAGDDVVLTAGPGTVLPVGSITVNGAEVIVADGFATLV